MHELVFLKSLIILLGASAVVVFLLHRIRVPSIVGFLLAGILLGPHALGFIQNINTIQTFAEIGVILLLFTIGLEFSLSRFLKMRMEVFGIGGLYVLITVLLTALLSYHWLQNLNTAIFMGFLVALSSTAIVMKLLSDKGELDSFHGRISVGILIFQDLCVVLFMLLVPVMSGGGEASDLIFTFGKAIAIITIVLLSAKWIVPNLLHQIVHTKSRELFVITILILCFGIAFLTFEFGLSLALGAFLAGLVISESEYSHEATSAILPFRDSFNGLFFVSVGMLMNLSFFTGNLFPVLSLAGGIILLKSFSGFFSMYLMRRPLRTSMQSSLNLSQVGEFSFVLAVAGLNAGVISDDLYQGFLSASVLTMLLTPLIMQTSPFISGRLSSQRLLKRLENLKEKSDTKDFPKKRTDHVIIVGFGLNGKNLARVLREADIPYAVLELDIDTVRNMKKQGEPIYYGDGTKVEVLQKLGIRTARTLVVAISDPASCRKIVKLAKKQNPELSIIARTRYTAEVDDLLKLGADDVIPEEFETSIEIFSRVLTQYQIPRNVIFSYVDMIRKDGYQVFRQGIATTRKQLFEKCSFLSHFDIEPFIINADSPAVDKSIKDLSFRTKTGTTIIAVERDYQILAGVDPDFTFAVGDTVFITGNKEDIKKAETYLAEGAMHG